MSCLLNDVYVYLFSDYIFFSFFSYYVYSGCRRSWLSTSSFSLSVNYHEFFRNILVRLLVVFSQVYILSSLRQVDTKGEKAQSTLLCNLWLGRETNSCLCEVWNWTQQTSPETELSTPIPIVCTNIRCSTSGVRQRFR